MAYRIESSLAPRQKVKPVKNKDYLAFVRKLPCVICGVMPVEAAHLSKQKPEWGFYGRGKSQKSSDRFALPLCPNCHRLQHEMGEGAFWQGPIINRPYKLCLIIWGLWCERGDEAESLCEEIIRRQL